MKAYEMATELKGLREEVENSSPAQGALFSRAQNPVQGALVPKNPAQSAAVSQLNRTMRGAGWEIEYMDLDLTTEQPKVKIRVNRNDGRFLIATVDSAGRASFETFQREKALRMDSGVRGRRPLSPMVDDLFLGRQRFGGARSMLRGMVSYLADNAINSVALSDMRAAWAGVMSSPEKFDAAALPAPEAGNSSPAQGAESKRRTGSQLPVARLRQELVTAHAFYKVVIAERNCAQQEVDNLRHDIERHIAIASELATENEALRAELAKADGQINRCVEQNKYLESTISRLREYAGHKPSCYCWAYCDCGYDELMKELEGSK